MTLAQLFHAWFLRTLSLSGMGSLVLLAGAVALSVMGESSARVPIWLAPAIATGAGVLGALPLTIMQFRQSSGRPPGM